MYVVRFISLRICWNSNTLNEKNALYFMFTKYYLGSDNSRIEFID